MSSVKVRNALKLDLDSVSVKFGNFEALTNISFTVEKGSRLGIIGNNGAGKSTLFNLISGLITKEEAGLSGSVLFDEINQSNKSAYKRARLKLGRVFQHPSLCEELSIIDNVLIGTSNHRASGVLAAMLVPKHFDKSEMVKAKNLASKCGLDEFLHSKVSSIPYATAKKVELARALMSEPELLLLDEPAASMNEDERAKYIDVLKSTINETDCTVLVIEHDVEFLKSFCDHLMILDQGKIIKIGPIDEVLLDEKAMNIYLGKGG